MKLASGSAEFTAEAASRNMIRGRFPVAKSGKHNNEKRFRRGIGGVEISIRWGILGGVAECCRNFFDAQF